jgi:hypothetical protein
MNHTRKIVIIGATSSMAEHCARRWLSQAPAYLVLVGRDRDRTERVAADLRVRSPESTVSVTVTDFLDELAIGQAVDQIVSGGDVDTVLIAHGSLPDQATCETDPASCREALNINGISPVLFAEAFARHMASAGHGTLAILGSVAGDRGRKSNYVYGAAKGLVTRYAQGLQHRFAASGIHIVLIKPGPTDTPMTAQLKAGGARLASVESVAAGIVAAIEQGKPVAYVPGKWRIIMMIIRHLPGILFNRLNI